MLVFSPRRQAKIRRRRGRAGLAPVELIFVLPVWMMIAALMVLVGTTGVWRLRTQAVSREAAFRAVWPRNRTADTRPREWSVPSATMNTSPASPAVVVDDPFASHTAIRGPVLIEPLTQASMTVDRMIMPTTSDVIRGQTSLDHEAAVWRRLGYRYRMSREFPVLSGDAGQFTPASIDRRDRRRASRIWGFGPIR
jgi:hypothetical protein